MPVLSPAVDPPLESTPSRMGNVRWTICAMLFVATSINYMDRQVIGILKPTLMHTIGLTEQNYGYIIAAFQVAYAVGLLAAGRLVDRLGSRTGYSLIMATWSLAAMAHALVSTAFGFGIARFFLGIGEAGNFPAAIKTVADWFPKRERSLATGIFNSGATVGAIVAPIVVPWITLRYGWHAAFLATGLVGAPWIAWWYAKYRKPQEHPTLTGAELRHIYEENAAQMGPRAPWRRLLGYRQTWAIAAARFLTDPIWWFYLFWLPGFLETRFHLGLTKMGLPLVLIYAASAVGGIAGGWLPSFLDRIGLHGSKARLTAMLLCACLSVPMLAAGRMHSVTAVILVLSLAVAGHQGWSANLYTTVSDTFPASAVGSVTGITAMAGSLGGVLLSVGAGYLLQVTGNYTTLFVIAATVYLAAWLILRLFASELRQVALEA